MKTFVFTNKNEFETDVITEILNFENIAYKTKLLNPYCSEKFYDITIMNTTYEHFLFVKKLAEKKLAPYITVAKSYSLPTVNRSNKQDKIIIIPPQPQPIKVTANISVSDSMPVLEIQELFKQLDKELSNCEIGFKMAKEEKKENTFKSFLKKIFRG